MTTPDELLTTRLSLRRPESGDARAVLAVHTDARACAHNPSDALATMAEAEDLVGRWRAHWERFGFGYWVVRWAAPRGETVVARVRPANTASHRVAVRAGLSRAEHLDEDGEDGPDWLYTLVGARTGLR